MQVTTTNPAAVGLGAGVDYFVSPRISFTTDFRILFANVGTTWTAVGRTSVPVNGFDKLYASNGQVLGGIRIWLK
jgi:hypothetical protein